MGELSYAHLLITLIAFATWLIPLWAITERIGRHPALSLVALFVGPLYLWWLAYAHWPSQPSS
jgi:hypothetical protein